AVTDAKIKVTQERFPRADVLLELASITINTQRPAREILLERAPRFAHLADEIMAVCQAFVKRKVERNLMDFDDLLMNWKVLLEEGGPLAQQIAASYKAVLVDEYQDTNALQGQIVDLMARAHRNVTAGGRDAHQQAEFTAERILQVRDEGVPLSEIAVLYRAHRHVLELQVELTRRGIPYVVRSGLRFFEQAHIKDVVSHLKLIFNRDDEL